MRIPLNKIYRAFPELDRFSDEQCERYVLQAMRISGRRRLVRHTLEASVGVGIFFLVLFAVASVSPMTPGRGFIVAYAVLLVALPIVGWLIARDQLLRQAIKARLTSARCPACDYSLLGLPVHGEVVVCPECGEAIDLEHHGLTEADLLSNATEPGAATSSGPPGAAGSFRAGSPADRRRAIP